MDLGTTRLFRWDELPMEAVTDMIARKVITGEKVMAGHIWLKKGCVVPQHQHEAEQYSMVFSGALKFIINGQSIVVGPGQMLVIPSWVPHEAVAIDETYEMDVFSPIRYDWLERSDSYFTNPPTQPAGFDNPATGDNPARLIQWAEVPKEPLTPLIDRSFVSGERATVCNFLLRKGAVVPSHQHESEQLTWIRRGHLRLTVAGQPFEVPAGSVIRIPSHAAHMAEAIEETEATDLFGPRREDWMAGTDQYLRQGNR